MRISSPIRLLLLCWPLLQGCAGPPAAVSYCAPGDQACVRARMSDVLATRAPVWQSSTAAPGELAPPAAEENRKPPAAPSASRQTRRAVAASPVTVAPVTPPAPPPRAAAPAPVAPRAPAAPPPTVTTCDAGGCWQAGGGRYEGGAGNAYLDGGGRLCQRQGNFMQCF